MTILRPFSIKTLSKWWLDEKDGSKRFFLKRSKERQNEPWKFISVSQVSYERYNQIKIPACSLLQSLLDVTYTKKIFRNEV